MINHYSHMTQYIIHLIQCVTDDWVITYDNSYDEGEVTLLTTIPVDLQVIKYQSFIIIFALDMAICPTLSYIASKYHSHSS